LKWPKAIRHLENNISLQKFLAFLFADKQLTVAEAIGKSITLEKFTEICKSLLWEIVMHLQLHSNLGIVGRMTFIHECQHNPTIFMASK
jgi:hypothetical protein